MRKTKIICTLGPETDKAGVLEDLVRAGMDVARMNFSHGDHEEQGARIAGIKRIRQEMHVPVAMMLDTKGPEIRIKTFKDDKKVTIQDGQTFTFTTREVEGTSEIVTITYKNLPTDVSKGTIILVDDGLAEFIVSEVQGEDIICVAQNNAVLGNKKSVNVPGIKLNMSYMSEKDKGDIIFGAKNGVDFIAASFCRNAKDMLEVREILDENGGANIRILAKIENREGYENLDEILTVVDGIMVARGDMGVEVPFDDLPRMQKHMIKRCMGLGKRCITATQMLDSMINNPRPTRAEVSDVANAVYDGTSAIMLSGETSIGRYAVQAVEAMSKIAISAEDSIDYEKRFISTAKEKTVRISGDKITNAIAYSTCLTASYVGAKVVVAFTETGHTAKAVSSFRPGTMVIGMTPNENTFHRLSLSWGILPIKASTPQMGSDIYAEAIRASIKVGDCVEGDIIAIIAGLPVGFVSYSNNFRVHAITAQDVQMAADE